ncbi:MAG: ABC transporter permease [Chloroflexota bacterium]
MSKVWGIVRYEYLMGIRRWGVWVAFVVAIEPLLAPFMDAKQIAAEASSLPEVWSLAGLMALFANYFMPLVAGIAIADRLARDERLRVRELLVATPISGLTYVLGKYLGAVLAVLTPTLILVLLANGVLVAGGVPWVLIPYSLVAFLAINVPAQAFVGAFALACPLIMPVRVFQVLFVGYWFWGNFAPPEQIPTLSDTVLSPLGRYAAGGLFHTWITRTDPHYTTLEAALSLAVLAACAAAALFVLERYLRWRDSLA